MDLITKRMPVRDVGLPSWVKGVLGNHKIDKADTQLIRKGVVPSDMRFKENERSSIDYITTKSVDRDGEIVVPGGALLDHYRKHPVVLWVHDYKQMPVGKSLWIKADDAGLISKTQYSSKGKGAEVFDYRKEGFPMAKSIGFIPLEIVEERDFDSIDLKALGLEEKDLEGASRIFPKWLMLEYSDVPVPSNPDALQLAISKGIMTLDEAKSASLENNAYVFDFDENKGLTVEVISSDGDQITISSDVESPVGAESEKDAVAEGEDSSGGVLIEEEQGGSEVVMKPETTEDYHHIPVKSASLFVDESFRTITLSSSQGIKAVIGKLKSDPDGPTATQKYMFDSSKWSMDDAKEWVANHKDKEADEIKVDLDEEEGKMLQDRYGTKDLDEDEDSFIEIVQEKKEGSWFEKNISLDGISRQPEPEVKYKERWNKGMSKAFDIEAIDMPPSSFRLELMSRFLKCKVKNIFLNDYAIPSTLLGSYLYGFKEVMSDWDLKDVRNFGYNGSESPPIYEVIQLNSEKSEEFLIDGTMFFEKGKDRMAFDFYPSYWGMKVSLFSNVSIKEENKAVLKKVSEWVDENCFLKGESFSLGGDFIEKTGETWSDVFISSHNEDSLKRSLRLINEKGNDMSNRGIILTGAPGTGKTLSGRIMKNLADSTFIWVSSRDFIYSGSVGGVGFAFSLARKLSPTILFIEDIDNWLDNYTTDLLKTEMDGILKSKGVVTILTSNYPELLPDALIDRPGRFHDILELALPDPNARMRMLKAWIPGAEDKALDPLIIETKGMSGAHIYELVDFAKTIAEEDDIPIDDAIIISLKKLKEQRELIDRIRSGDSGNEEKEVFEIASDKSVDDVPVEEKAGRTLSKKTRSVLEVAVESMSTAVESIKEFMEAVDREDTIEVEVPDEVEEEEDKSLIFDGTITKEGLVSALKESLKEAVDGKEKLDFDEIFKKRLDLHKGVVT